MCRLRSVAMGLMRLAGSSEMRVEVRANLQRKRVMLRIGQLNLTCTTTEARGMIDQLLAAWEQLVAAEIGCSIESLRESMRRAKS